MHTDSNRKNSVNRRGNANITSRRGKTKNENLEPISSLVNEIILSQLLVHHPQEGDTVNAVVDVVVLICRTRRWRR